jgi:hypothetical protein
MYSVALRKNGKTLVSALSEEGSYNPVAQATLTYLQPGDVVQLEVIQGRVYETSSQEFAYTTFSGWLIGPLITSGPPARRRHDEECCCRICLPQNLNPPVLPTARPPYAPPSYAPPIVAPPAPPPTYIVTTQKPYNPLPGYTSDRVSGGRQDDHADEDLKCCDSLLLSSTSPRSRALEAQDEKFGVYRLQYVDRSPGGQGRATFKHISRDLFLFYMVDNDITGWIVGPNPGISIGGLFIRVFIIELKRLNDGNDGQAFLITE